MNIAIATLLNFPSRQPVQAPIYVVFPSTVLPTPRRRRKKRDSVYTQYSFFCAFAISLPVARLLKEEIMR